ncbi:MAG: TlpA family protein disulfide reductase [Planctomycetaceae bacterium]|jgi:thiol-disulfide isomerase/thioredoxin|nr:TlpA family protein disulfide reductase [Planctomycetaceae bacterium]
MRILLTLAVLASFTAKDAAMLADDQLAAQKTANAKTTENQEAGHYVIDPTKAPKVVKGESATEIDFNKLKDVDLKKEPWLVESVGLTPGHPAFQRPRMIWADSWMYAEAPEIEIEKWVAEPPKNLAGKFVLIEVWATWCPPCRRSLPYLNFLHEKYGDDLAVIAICETDEEAIKTMKGPLKPDEIKFHLAVDTGRRFANKLGVYGIPHTVILEPQFGAVIWEGMPTQPGHELSDEKVTKILSIGKKLKESGELPKTSPLKITVSKPEKTVQPPKGEGNSVQW